MRGLQRFLWLTIIAAGGCAPTAPTEATARSLVNDDFPLPGKNVVRIVSFTKNNGQAREEGGVRKYRMDYSALIEFTADACYISSRGYPSTPEPFNTYWPVPESGCGWVNFLDRSSTMAAKGTGMELTGTADFEQTEKGWRLIVNRVATARLQRP